MPKKETWSKLKNTVLRKLDWGTFFLLTLHYAGGRGGGERGRQTDTQTGRRTLKLIDLTGQDKRLGE